MERDSRARVHEFVLYAPESIALPLDARRFPSRTIAGSGGTWWEQVQVPRAVTSDHLDVWFAPAYTAPLRLNARTVVAIHDLSFVAHPEWFRLREGARRRWLTGQAASRAAAVITISEFSRRELVEHLGVPAQKIHVIPPGIGAGGLGLGLVTWLRACAPCPPQPQPPASSPYRVLFVGSIFNRRHVIDLIRAFAPIAAASDASLDIVVRRRSYLARICGRRLSPTVETSAMHQYLTDEQLAALYAGARAFAFLSEYEGLG